jgi:hypothetical protein
MPMLTNNHKRIAGHLMKITTRLVTLLALLLFVWYLFADRITPYTSLARVKAIVIEVVPQVSGYVAALAVTNARLVEGGDLLARIDQRPFVLEVEKARSALQSATQSVGANSSQVEVAQASLTQAEINLENVKVQSARIFELEQKGLVAKAKADDMRADLAAAESKVAGARADLEKARQQLKSFRSQRTPNARQLATPRSPDTPGSAVPHDCGLCVGAVAHRIAASRSPIAPSVSRRPENDTSRPACYRATNLIHPIQTHQESIYVPNLQHSADCHRIVFRDARATRGRPPCR